MPSAPPRNRAGGSLRLRLTVWNTAFLLLIMAGLFVGLQWGMAYALQREFDLILAAEVDEVRLLMLEAHGEVELLRDGLKRKATAHADRRWFAQVYDHTGVLLGETAVPVLGLTPPTTAAGPYSVGGRWRVIDATVLGFRNRSRIVRVGSDTHELSADARRFGHLLLIAGAGVLLLAPLFGYSLAAWATRPVTRLTETTARLRPEQLDERLPVGTAGDEIDRLSGTINGLLDRLADYVNRKRDFLAHAAHELRSPLTAIRSSVEVALHADRSPDEYKEFLAEVAEQTAGLAGLVNQLLLLAEGDAGKLHRGGTPQRLDRLTARAIEMFQGAAESNGVEVNLIAEPVELPADPGHLRLILHNLLDNALKFTPAFGRIDVAVTKAGGSAVLTVADSGPGIPPEHLPHIFERFYRADPARGGASTGLGLAICEALAQFYGGGITAASTPERGSSFTVTLPGATRPADEAAGSDTAQRLRLPASTPAPAPGQSR